MEYARMDPFQQATFNIYRGAGGLTKAVGGMMGAQDPELQKITMRKQMLQGLDLNDPESLKQAAQRFMQAGDYPAAQELMAKSQELQKFALDANTARATAAAKMAEKLTTEQRNAAAIADTKAERGTLEWSKAYNTELTRLTSKPEASTDAIRNAHALVISKGLDPESKEGRETYHSELLRLTTNKDGWKVQEVGVAEKSREPVYTITEPGKAPKQVVFKDVNGEQKMVPFNGGVDRTTSKVSATANAQPGVDAAELAKQVAKEVAKPVAGIETQYTGLDYVQKAYDLLDKGIFTGFYAPAALQAAKATSKDNPKVVNTEAFIAYIGNVVVPRLQEFGGNDSNEEMKYLKQISGGNISMERETLRRILKSTEEKIQRGIERTRRQQEAAKTGGPAPTDPGPSRDSSPRKADPLGIR